MNLALIVPDSLGPGPRQEILDKVGSRFRAVYFVPRTVAGAIAWCESDAGRSLAQEKKSSEVGRVGSLLVTTTATDTWEAAVVPIRVEGDSEGRGFRPVHDRVGYRSEIGTVGLAKCIPPGLESLPESPCDTWQAWLEFDGCDFRLARPGREREELAHVFSRWSLLGNSLEGRESQEFSSDALGALDEALGEGRLLEWIHLGRDGDRELPEEFRDFEDRVALRRVHLGPEATLRAGNIVLDRVQRGQVPYYESLAQIDLYVVGRNDYQDPIEDWRSLIEATEVPVGRTYVSPSPIDDLSLPAGEVAEIDLYVRSQRHGDVVFGHRRVSQNQSHTDPEPVSIRAKLDPGQGLAQIEVESTQPGLFFASIRENDLAHVNSVRPLTYAWPPGSAWIVPNASLVDETRRLIRDVESEARRGGVTKVSLNPVRESMNVWLLPENLMIDRNSIEVPDYISREFVYLGVVSSAINVDGIGSELWADYSRLLSESFDQTSESKTKDSLLWASSWLYQYCPPNVLEHVRKAMRDGARVTAPELACAGNCFIRPEDHAQFFKSLEAHISSRETSANQYWVRAYRNLIRFRAEALNLDVFPKGAQNRVLRWYFNWFQNSIKNSRMGNIGYCARLAPHLLKRRRFDSSFLAGDTPNYIKFTKLIGRALGLELRGVHKTDLECTLAFLAQSANQGTLERLRSGDAKG